MLEAEVLAPTPAVELLLLLLLLLEGEALALTDTASTETPLKQLSQIFCLTFLSMCGSSSLLFRWSEQTSAPHLRQWCLRLHIVNGFRH